MTSHTPRTHGDALSGAFGGLPAHSPARSDGVCPLRCAAARSMQAVHDPVVATVAWRELAATSVVIMGACAINRSDLGRSRGQL